MNKWGHMCPMDTILVLYVHSKDFNIIIHVVLMQILAYELVIDNIYYLLYKITNQKQILATKSIISFRGNYI